eukprot:gene20165-26901_t
MPLVLDDDPKATGFDLQTAQTLFWRPVPVLLRQNEREDMTEDFNFRILTGYARQNHNLRILRIHISSESDLFFLHSLEVSEEDFQSLKNEQGILVDFASFPSKIITLLDKCTSAQPSDAPRAHAFSGAHPFKSTVSKWTLPAALTTGNIITLLDKCTLAQSSDAPRPGNDTYIKQFLAFRLGEIKDNCTNLSDELKKTKEERGTAETGLRSLRSTQQQLAQLREEHDRHLMQMQAESSTQKASAHEAARAIRTAAQVGRAGVCLVDQAGIARLRERSELQRKLGEQIDALSTRLAELDSDNRKLRDAKYELDAKLVELDSDKRKLRDATYELDADVQMLID